MGLPAPPQLEVEPLLDMLMPAPMKLPPSQPMEIPSPVSLSLKAKPLGSVPLKGLFMP
jgi:hypothetical protein